MSRIKRLPQKVANQIAAGEVIERPASAVKELLENAIDAGASQIFIEVEDGGKQLIKVSDNGSGMSRKDVELSVEPHATSKIYDERGLEEISTLGFRGEALASIGAVSELTVASREETSDTGWRTRVIFGRVKETEAFGMPEGTEVTVENLFLDIPARRKFLKRRQTELGHVTMKVRTAAVIYPEIEFRLQSEGRTIFRSRKGVKGPERLWPLLGEELSSRLVQFNAGDTEVNTKGFISRPADAMSNPRAFYFFLNGRPITDRLLWKAVSEAGRGFFMKGNYPAGALFIKISPSLVDVNVHPAKHEVRFHDSNRIFRLIYHGIRNTLSQPREESPHACLYEPVKEREDPLPEIKLPETPFKKTERNSIQQTLKAEGIAESAPLPWESDKKEERRGEKTDISLSNASTETLASKFVHTTFSESQEPPSFSSMSIIGQFASTYIIAEQEGIMFLVDQHAAHEAILFKRLKKDFMDAGSSLSQPLLFPRVVELNPAFVDRLDSIGNILKRIGIVAEKFGESEIVIKALPVFLADSKTGLAKATAVMDRLFECPEQELDSALHDIMASFACRLAVKAGQKLEKEEMRSLLAEIGREKTFHCPHGRPIMQRLTVADMEKMFGRTG